MASVPLTGFPPEFQARCFKCSSSSVHFLSVRHPFMWGQREWGFKCYTCGSVKYGDAAIRGVFEPLLKAWETAQIEEKAAQERLAVLLQEERERVLREREAALLAEEARLARKEAERARRKEQKCAAGTLCAMAGCGNRALLKSKYCSRACSNRNAHARAKGRQALLPPKPKTTTPKREVVVEAGLSPRQALLYRKAHYLPSHHSGTVTG